MWTEGQRRPAAYLTERHRTRGIGRNTLLPALQVRGIRGQGVSGLHSLWERYQHAEVWSNEATDHCVDLDPEACGSAKSKVAKAGQRAFRRRHVLHPDFQKVALESLSLPVLGDPPCLLPMTVWEPSGAVVVLAHHVAYQSTWMVRRRKERITFLEQHFGHHLG